MPFVGWMKFYWTHSLERADVFHTVSFFCLQLTWTLIRVNVWIHNIIPDSGNILSLTQKLYSFALIHLLLLCCTACIMLYCNSIMDHWAHPPVYAVSACRVYFHPSPHSAASSFPPADSEAHSSWVGWQTAVAWLLHQHVYQILPGCGDLPDLCPFHGPGLDPVLEVKHQINEVHGSSII